MPDNRASTGQAGRYYFDEVFFAEAVADPPATGTEGAGAQTTPAADEATGESNGTAAEDTRTQPDASESETPDGSEHTAGGEEPKYSEASLAAAREEAIAEGKRQARLEEREKARTETKKATTEALRNLRTNSVREMRLALREHELDDSQIDNALKPYVNTWDQLEEAANLRVADTYKAEIEDALENDEERVKAFWAAVDPEDKGAAASDVLRTFAEHYALTTEAVRQAEPEKLIASNPKLKAHIAKLSDEKYASGREQGKKDPIGDKSSDEGRATGSGGWTTKAQARALHVQGKITHEEMRRIRSDPSIPEGYS